MRNALPSVSRAAGFDSLSDRKLPKNTQHQFISRSDVDTAATDVLALRRMTFDPALRKVPGFDKFKSQKNRSSEIVQPKRRGGGRIPVHRVIERDNLGRNSSCARRKGRSMLLWRRREKLARGDQVIPGYGSTRPIAIEPDYRTAAAPEASLAGDLLALEMRTV